MGYIELSLNISGEIKKGCDITIAELAEIGFESFEESEYGVKAYISEEYFDEKLIKDLIVLNSSEFKGTNISYRIIETVNWNSEWENNYEPVAISNFCYVRALFHPETEGFKHSIVIHPKMSFGTGHHETTWLMIDAMRTIDFKERSVLDMGCGTGILAIMASKLGAKGITAIDIDDWAVENSSENIILNNRANIDILKGDIDAIDRDNYDIILANITRNVLTEYMEPFSKLLSSNGILVISGFYIEDIEDLTLTAKRYGFILISSNVRNRWATAKFIKQTPSL